MIIKWSFYSGRLLDCIVIEGPFLNKLDFLFSLNKKETHHTAFSNKKSILKDREWETALWIGLHHCKQEFSLFLVFYFSWPLLDIQDSIQCTTTWWIAIITFADRGERELRSIRRGSLYSPGLYITVISKGLNHVNECFFFFYHTCQLNPTFLPTPFFPAYPHNCVSVVRRIQSSGYCDLQHKQHKWKPSHDYRKALITSLCCCVDAGTESVHRNKDASR